MATFTWLITGASSGLGAEISLAALRAGHKVVATARNTTNAKDSYPDIEKQGGSWITLDVTDPDTQSIVDKVVRDNGVNVIVNNAGYALRGVLEDLTQSQIQAQMATNFFGALSVTKGAIPYFREQRSGTIVNISSTSGMTGNAGYSLYAASKFALEGASESLAAELAPFGIRVLIVEPGGYRTNFQAAVTGAEVKDGHVSEPYKGTIADQTAQKISAGHGKQPGDPQKAGQAIVEVVTGTGRGKDVGNDLLRLPLGKDAVLRAKTKVDKFTKDVERVKHISEWAVYDGN